MKEEIPFHVMYQAYLDCRKKKRSKEGAKQFEHGAFYYTQELTDDINRRRYKVGRSKCFIVKQPTTREVFCALFRDRVVQHFVYNELNPYMDRKFIYDTANCRVGKGTDFAIHRVEHFVRSATDNGHRKAYYLKMDLSGFFMSIDRKLLLEMVQDFVDMEYKGKYSEALCYLLPLIILNDCTKDAIRISPASDWDKLPANKTLFGNDHGMPIGNICSQLFANFYLNDLDHILKSRHRFVSRYVDDIIVVDTDREKLMETLEIVRAWLPQRNLRLNNNKTRISDVKFGIPYLGVKIYPFKTVLGKSRKNRTYNSGYAYDAEQPEKVFGQMASRWGMFRNYHGRRFAETWYSSLPEEIRTYVGFDKSSGFSRVEQKEYRKKNRKMIPLYGGVET